MATVAPAPNISCYTYWGLRTDIKHNAYYISDEELLYPAGTMIIVQNIPQKKQRFMKLPETNRVIKALVLAPNRRWLALNELGSEGELPTVTIYDLNTFKRRKVITIPAIDDLKEPKATEIACIQFSFDSKFLMVVTGEPDWYLYHFNWDKMKLESYTKAKNPDGHGTVDSIQCNPADATLIVLTGPYTFRIMNVLEASWRQWGWSKADNIIITSSMWLNADRIIIGTSTGQIMMIENGDLRMNCIFNASEVVEMSLKKIDVEIEGEDAEPEEETKTSEEEAKHVYPVRHLINFSKGFAYACGEGFVYLFEMETIYFFKRRSVFRICKKSYKSTREFPMWSELDDITHMVVSPNEDTLLITTHRKQPFIVKIFTPITEMSLLRQEEYTPFEEFGPSMHYGSINSITMCAWKPIFITAGEYDKSIRIWNYKTLDIEMVKIYQEEIHCVSLHPTGLFAIVGFSDKLRFMVVLIDDFEVMREFPVRNCKQAKFSTNGHLFAAVNGQVIQVFSAVSFQNIFNLKGHNGRITCLAWSSHDLILVSSGAEGAVYEWSMSTGQRVGEIILKTNQFNACAVNSVGNITYAAGTDGEIKMIGGNAINKRLKMKGYPFNAMVLSRSNMMLFVAGEGTITSVTLPLSEQQNKMLDFTKHFQKVTCLALTYDDQTLITVGEDASIGIWRLLNPDGRAIALDPDFAHAKEILISRKDLQEKINSINLLSTRMSELDTEHTYQFRQSEATHAEKLKEIHDGYCKAIEELKEKNENMDNMHTHEIGSIQQDIAKLRASHEKTLQELEAEFNIRLISEYDRYESLENKTARMRKEYEARLETLMESKRKAMRGLNSSFEAKLEEKDQLLQEIQEEAELEKREHITITEAIEDDADREIQELKTAFDAQLNKEKDSNVRLKGEIGLMRKKLIGARKEIDEYKHDIVQLKAEHKQFQKVISSLDKEILDIKKDIAERDVTIQNREKRIFQLKKKKNELEKYKFVLNYTIADLKNQIEPLERAIKESKLRTLELEESLETLLKARAFRELKIQSINEKLNDAKKQFTQEVDKTLTLKTTLKKIKIDLHDMTADFQDPVKLKHSVKALFKKYTEDKDFLRNRASEDAAVQEFYRQRQFLEQQVELCKRQLQKAYTMSKNDINKILDENCSLLAEINSLRVVLKTTRARCFHMESILGLSARYVPPAEAHAKLDYVTEDRNKLINTYRDKFREKQRIITSLNEENLRLVSKISGTEWQKGSEDHKSSVPSSACTCVCSRKKPRRKKVKQL